MSQDSIQTLFHPFEAEYLDLPSAEDRCLVLGAGRDFRTPVAFSPKITMVQGFRPEYLALQKRGLDVIPEPEGEDFALALIIAGRHRAQNEFWLAQAGKRVRSGGLIVMAGGKTDGVASLRKRLEKSFPLGGHLSKNHGIVFWFTRDTAAEVLADGIRDEQARAPLVEGLFKTSPGAFSYDRVDTGSRLLADALKPEMRGIAADFCAGWGYLSAMLAERTKVARADLYEADHASLEAARQNMARAAPGIETNFHWRDLTSEKVERIYDLIVMNPPFHQGRAAEPGLGQSIIRTAAAALKPRGRLLMVANRGLPYEALLRDQFAACEIVIEDKGFRVYSALR
jgi:16S rRNA (guanine1207-N2)-methyltransferase